MAGVAKLNIGSILGKVANSKKLQVKSQQILDEKVFEAQDQIYGEFVSHPVTRDISSKGSDSYFGNRASLFGFLGFDAGSDPIRPILTLLQSTAKTNLISVKVVGKNVELRYTTKRPSANDVYEATRGQLTWAPGLSWVELYDDQSIEGFEHFLPTKDSKASRSQQGVQSQFSVPKSFEMFYTDYVAKMLANFPERVRKVR